MANTQSKEVNLTKRIKTNNGMRYRPSPCLLTGASTPDFVIINGQPVRHPDGAYYLERQFTLLQRSRVLKK